MWVYRRVPSGQYALGYFSPGGEFMSIKMFNFESECQRFVSYLNGGTQ
jgi:hypothetical protein